jgi:hypothetical protein
LSLGRTQTQNKISDFGQEELLGGSLLIWDLFHATVVPQNIIFKQKQKKSSFFRSWNDKLAYISQTI